METIELLREMLGEDIISTLKKDVQTPKTPSGQNQRRDVAKKKGKPRMPAFIAETKPSRVKANRKKNKAARAARKRNRKRR